MKAAKREPQPRASDAPEALWALATRVYHDHDAPQEQREREWLLRALRAHRAGNWVHLARMVGVCDLLQIPPPPQLAAALAPILQAAATGETLGTGDVGRHAQLLRKAADAVRDVESLMQLEAARDRLTKAKRRAKAEGLPKPVPQGHDALAEARAYFRATSVRFEAARTAPDGMVQEWREAAASVSDGYHEPRTRDALEKHATNARKLLRDPEARAFIGANFPPRLLEKLAKTRKKPT